jgi:hypothetical protein
MRAFGFYPFGPLRFDASTLVQVSIWALLVSM